MRRVLGIIDSINSRVGHVACWFLPALILLVMFDVIARYAFDYVTAWGYEMSMMIGAGLIFMWGYVQLHKGHIRIDVLYERLSARKQATIDAVCCAIMAFPCLAFAVRGAYSKMLDAIIFKEKMAESYWLPPAWPFRTAVFVALCLVILQFVATFIRDLHMSMKGKPL
jgi:TRAP-type mannitol/chloroaromatic compound transport system permease small subunit